MQEILILVLIGLLAGAMSGVLGIGGGMVVIPALVMILGYSQLQAQGTSLGLLLPPLGILAFINYYNKGFVNIKAVIFMSGAFIIGSYFSSKFVVELPDELIKKVFAVFLVLYAAKIFIGK